MRASLALIAVILVAGATAGAVWAINAAWAAHPSGESFALEQRAATAVTANHPIVFPSRINESVLRWCIAEQLSTPPTVVLLGSSHGLHVSAATLGTPGLMNFSISGAMFADHLVTTEILTRRKVSPRTWIIFVDAWFFNPLAENDFQKYRARPDEIRAIEKRLAERSSPPIKPLFTPLVNEYLRTRRRVEFSLEPIYASFDRFARGQWDSVVVPEGDFQATLMLADGALQAASDKQPISSGDAKDLALRQFASKPDRFRYGTYSKIDDGLWSLFSRWTDFLRDDGATVIWVLSPYHPAIFGRIVSQPGNQLRALESQLRATAEQKKVPLVGSYDPSKAQVEESDFLDGDHLRESALKRLLAPISQATAAPPSAK